MEKRTYIQPEMKVAVMPKDALMGEDLILSSSGSMGTVGGAPKRIVDPTTVRRTEVF